MASASRYEWIRADGTKGKAWRAKWVGADGQAHRKRGFDRKTDALRYGEDREAEARHGLDLGGDSPTLTTWAKVWLDQLEVRDSTRRSYASALGHILPVFGGRPLHSIRAAEVKAFRRTLSMTHAVSTVNTVVGVLSAMLNEAVRNDLLTKSPVPARTGSREGRSVDPDQLLTVDDVLAWSESMPSHARALPVVAALTGLRQGELLGLRLDHVDFLRRSLRVVEQLVTAPGGPVYGPPKTPASVREVPLSTAALEALAGHLAAFPAVEGEPLFRTKTGRRWSRQHFRLVWHKAKVAAGLPEWVHWHALRDHYASALIRQGLDQQTIATNLGHSSTRTLSVYSRVWPDSADRSRQAMDAAWSSARSHRGPTGDTASL